MTYPPIPPDDGADSVYSPANNAPATAPHWSYTGLLRTLATTPDLPGWVQRYLQIYDEPPARRQGQGRAATWVAGFTVLPTTFPDTVIVAFQPDAASTPDARPAALLRCQRWLERVGLEVTWDYPTGAPARLLVHRPVEEQSNG